MKDTAKINKSSVTVACIRCPCCGVDIYPPDDLAFKFVSRARLREYSQKYIKKKVAGDKR